MKKTLIIFNHPNFENSVFNRALLERAKKQENVLVRHLDAIYGSDTKGFDIQKEQELLVEYERIIFQFPIHWFSTPAMLKAYQDMVFSYGFAFGQSGDKLVDKEFKAVLTIGSTQEAYQAGGWNDKSINEILSPLQTTARFCGMIYTRAFTIYSTTAKQFDQQEIEELSNKYELMLQDQDWCEGLIKYKR
ncbi:NAD(P)H-dependent oxidoreductase [Helicobacter brantae]|uniref:General stress protein n=1 Tax=Helicobacter brantae TaxID=375927 RepID=A0A3D8J1E6_9HELI|nr:NAD(P)H-dependent oxidoreductase [Helicobacter brantae]RDU70601.1 general stress protein [Helicobacter brantae]